MIAYWLLLAHDCNVIQGILYHVAMWEAKQLNHKTWSMLETNPDDCLPLPASNGQ